MAGSVLFVTLLIYLSGNASDFKMNLAAELTRKWVGPDFWTNRLEDWRVNQGKLECFAPATDRYLYLLTRDIKPASGTLEVVFKAAVPELPERPRTKNFIGLRLGIKGKTGDYREAAVNGQGMEAGLSTDGLLLIGDLESVSSEEKQERLKSALKKAVELRLRVESRGNECLLRLTVSEAETGKVLDELEDYDLPSEKIAGGLAVVSSLPEIHQTGENPVSRFEGFQISGSLLEKHEERAFGPVAFTLYTLSKNSLKLSTQFIPWSLSEGARASLEIQREGDWQKMAESSVDRESWTALFKVANWKFTGDVGYRIVVDDKNWPGMESLGYSGKIRKEPVDKAQLIMAVLSNNHEDGFPHPELVANLKKHDPDLVFFGGNQVYGRPASFWREKVTLEQMAQEYLRQWLLFGWAFGEILKDRPAIIIPDCGDFFQSKLWGEGGKLIDRALASDPIEAQDNGGYWLPVEFIRLVLKTQTSYLPDSEVAEISDTGIKSYFCEVNYAGLGLAVLDDRMFKSAPQALLPEAQIRNGWALNPDFDLKKQARLKSASLHGQEQLRFLEKWAADWSSGTWMKAVLSQSLWVSLLTLPEGSLGDEALFRLALLQPGTYPPNDRPVADFNTGGWPQSGRDEALKILRKALAVHITGSGGPASALKYGLEKFDEAGWAFVPSPIINSWPARWFPQPAVRTARKKEPSASGNFEDAFGNKFSVRAVSNPYGSEVLPVYRGAPGYGIVRFERKTHQIIFENWPRAIDPTSPEAGPYPGWPVVVNQLENDGRKAAGYLPLLKFKGIENPVVQVVEEKGGEIIYTLRIRGTEFRPAVYQAGNYTVRCGEPGTSNWKEIKKLSSLPAGVKKIKLVDFRSGPPER